jgi:hypothetical protein
MDPNFIISIGAGLIYKIVKENEIDFIKRRLRPGDFLPMAIGIEIQEGY